MAGMADDEAMTDAVLTAVGPRLRALRHRRRLTLTQLSEETGISVSTLSRLESGQRRPTLELLLPLARATRCPSTSWSARRRPGTRGCTCGRAPRRAA